MEKSKKAPTKPAKDDKKPVATKTPAPSTSKPKKASSDKKKEYLVVDRHGHTSKLHGDAHGH